MFDCCCLVESYIYGRKKRQKKGSKFGQRSTPMEYGDTSDEEAPPCDPKSNNLTKKEQSKVISMVVDMETEDGLKRRAVMVVAKKIGWHIQTYSTINIKYSAIVMYSCGFNIYNIELGLIISSEFFHAKKLRKKHYLLPSSFINFFA